MLKLHLKLQISSTFFYCSINFIYFSFYLCVNDAAYAHPFASQCATNQHTNTCTQVSFISAFLCGCCACVTSLRAQWKAPTSNDINHPSVYNFDSSIHDDGRMSFQLPRNPVPRNNAFPSTFALARPLTSAHGQGTRLEVRGNMLKAKRLSFILLSLLS